MKMGLVEATKIATVHLILKFSREAFEFGFQQALSQKARLTQSALFEELDYGSLRNYHKKVVWEAYKSGRFEPVASFQLDIKY